MIDIDEPVTPGDDWPLALGTVGWVDDDGKIHDLADGGTGEASRTLVRVTLFRGRTPTTKLDATQAQGQQLLCQLGVGFFRIPPKGTPVLVAIPQPYGHQPGASVIISTLDAGAFQTFGNIKPGEWCVGAPGIPGRLIGKKDGTIVAYTVVSNQSMSVEIGPRGFKAVTPWGAISIDASNGILMTAGSAGLMLTPTGDAKLIGTTATVSGSVAAIAGDVMTMLGKAATPSTGVGYGVPGATPPVASSASVFVSPT